MFSRFVSYINSVTAPNYILNEKNILYIYFNALKRTGSCKSFVQELKTCIAHFSFTKKNHKIDYESPHEILHTTCWLWY